MSTNTIDIDPDALDRFMGQFVTDLGATLSAALVVIGDELGLYRALDEAGPLNADALAARTGTDPRYVREWLSNQAAGGYVTYDASSDTFRLTPEQSLALAQEGSPAFVPGAFQLATALIRDAPTIRDAFRTGRASAGTSTTMTCSSGPSGSFVPATAPTSSRPGYRRLTGSSPSSATAPWSPMSAADTAPRR